MIQIANISDARQHLTTYSDNIVDNNVTLIITRADNKNLIVQSLDNYNLLANELNNLKKELHVMGKMRQAEAALASGQRVKSDDVFSKMQANVKDKLPLWFKEDKS